MRADLPSVKYLKAQITQMNDSIEKNPTDAISKAKELIEICCKLITKGKCIMEITPYKNGIHSLAESLRCLQLYLSDTKDPYLMKEVVIKSHHGLETLFKDILFHKNPVFLLDGKTSVKDIVSFYKGFYENKNDYLFDDARTITPSETLQRLRDLRIIEGTSIKDYEQLISSFEILNAFRNQLQHFAIKADTDKLIRLLGNLIPRAVVILKRYYTGINNVPFYLRETIIPHEPLFGMEKLFGTNRNVEEDLNSIFPQATDIIKMLESKYDILLNEAIQKFKKTTFSDLKLSIKIRDHGHCGASPYMPEIVLEGWLNETLKPHENSMTERFFIREHLCAIYNAQTVINQPCIIEEPKDFFMNKVTKNCIFIDATIAVLNSSNFFSIPNVEEYIEFIKSPEVKLKIELEYEAEGIYDEWHYDIRRVRQLKGKVLIEMSSMIYGDCETQPSIIGRQEILLDSINTSISLHASVESNKKLRNNYSLDIGIEGMSSLMFT